MDKNLRRWLAAAAGGLTMVAVGTAGVARAAPATQPAAAAQPVSVTDSPGLAQSFSGRLYGITATSASNAWGVGLNPSGSLIVHWNGKSWAEQASASGFFQNVAATSASDAWAVGGTGWFTTQPLVEHWDGTAWASSASTPKLALGGFLSGVTAISARDVWAVGVTGGGPGDGTGTNNHTVIEHWNGSQWSRIASPSPAPAAELQGISAVSPTDIWAVGWDGTAGPNGDKNRTTRTLVLHWNGRRWSVVPSPSGQPGVRTEFSAVLALSATDAWAVGATHLNSNHLVFTAHWNGRTWTQVHAPTPTVGASLNGIGGTSASNIWAVGQTTVYGGCDPVNCGDAVLHWNGKRWAKVTVPNPSAGYLNALFGVAVTSAGNAWAAGTTDYRKTLIVRWNGHRWN